MSDLPEIRNGQSKDKMPYHREAETHFQRKIRRGSTVLLDHITKVTTRDDLSPRKGEGALWHQDRDTAKDPLRLHCPGSYHQGDNLTRSDALSVEQDLLRLHCPGSYHQGNNLTRRDALSVEQDLLRLHCPPGSYHQGNKKRCQICGTGSVAVTLSSLVISPRKGEGAVLHKGRDTLPAQDPSRRFLCPLFHIAQERRGSPTGMA